MAPLIILALVISVVGGILTLTVARKEDVDYGKNNRNLKWISASYIIAPLMGFVILILLVWIFDIWEYLV